jgi:hypothetical protein
MLRFEILQEQVVLPEPFMIELLIEWDASRLL